MRITARSVCVEQALALPPILQGKDIVLAAETGSGKTISYLAPGLQQILNRLCGLKDARAEQLDAEHEAHARKLDRVTQSLNESTEIRIRKAPPRLDGQWLLVLSPSAALCQQIGQVAAEIMTATTMTDGSSMATRIPIIQINSRSRISPELVYPTPQPAVVISTPLALLNAMDLQPVVEDSIARGIVRTIVLDEVDMLLSGGFMKASWSILDLIEKPYPKGVLPRLPCLQWPVPSQLVLCGATVPNRGLKSVEQTLRERFPRLEWVNGDLLHRHSPRVEYKWLQVVDSDGQPRLDRSSQEGGVKNRKDCIASLLTDSRERILVFANSATKAEGYYQEIQAKLGGGQVTIVRYYSGISAPEKNRALDAFRDESYNSPIIMICTDAASRGLDLPRVDHVIMAECATSAVDFLHRVGRTARAGSSGKVSILFAQEDELLVSKLREAAEENKSIENAFSRQRLLRKKYKKEREAAGAD